MNRAALRLFPVAAVCLLALCLDIAPATRAADELASFTVGVAPRPAAALLFRRRAKRAGRTARHQRRAQRRQIRRRARVQRRATRGTRRTTRRSARREERALRRARRRQRRGRLGKKIGSFFRRAGQAIGRGFTKLVGGIKRGWQKFVEWARRFPPIDKRRRKKGRCHVGKRVEVDYSKWRLTFRDEFNGSDGSACFTKAPQCQQDAYWGGVGDCPQETWANLKDLNKCNWYAMHYKNYMFEAVNNFHPRDVTVEGGNLILTSRARDQGQVTPGACPVGGRWSPSCKFSAGGLESRPRGPVAGFQQKYGRWEVRAKLPTGVGNWPAHWLMPSDPGATWPTSGEIDIMELVGPPNEKVTFNLHYTAGGAHQSNGAGCNLGKRTQFSDGFHTFAIEWEPTQIRWFVDDYLVKTIKATDKNENGHSTFIPSMNFFWILNTSITTMGGYKPDARSYGVHRHYIDYVRVYSKK